MTGGSKLSENKNNIDDLIKEAIDASLKFEAIMDSIDFNSYLPEDQKSCEVKDTPLYKNYIKMVEKASNRCKNIIKKIDAKINDTFEPKPGDKDEVIGQYLIYHLFEAKKTRLKARQQVKRKDEEKDYIDSTHRLHKAFYHILRENFYYPQKDKNLLENYNWAKVLYYNEMAICYSGLTESSMSLGYSERSIFLLKEINSRHDSLTSKTDQGTYTFALYNKGEAEKLLGNDDLALKTFRTIVDFCEKEGLESSDYHSALLRMASILTDMGRGEEAKKLLERVKVGKRSFQFIERELELASVYIDTKEYKKALKVLIQFESPQWKHTSAKRKAKIYLFRLLNEYRKNRPEDFQKTYESTEYDAIKARNLSGVTYDKKTKKVRMVHPGIQWVTG
jgi:predicted negative regulator of RcsB-dependent stress response